MNAAKKRVRQRYALPETSEMNGTRTCTVCRETKSEAQFVRSSRLRSGLAGHCRACQKRINADWYRRHADRISARSQDYDRRHPEKAAAHEAVHAAILAGVLTRKPCVVCGNPQAQAHHHSYAEADRLNVTWVCVLHHRDIHRDPNHPLNPNRGGR